MSQNFYRQIARGKKAEEIVKQHLQGRGHEVIDVSENPNFQEIDTDLIVIDKATTNSIKVEVKADYNISKTGNFIFEIETEDNYGRKVDGWTKYTEADYVCVFDMVNSKGYMIAWTALKPVLSTFGRADFFYDKYDQKMTEVRLISVGTLKREGFIDYEWKEEE